MATASPPASGPALVRRVVAENAIVVAIMAAYIVASAAAAAIYRFSLTITLYAPFWAVMAGCVGLYAVARPLALRNWRLGERLAMAAPILILAPAFFSAFTSIKTALPLIHPYAWDARLPRAHARLFGGAAR